MWLGEQEGEEQQWAAMPVWDLPKAGTVRKVKAKYLRKGGNATSGLLLTCLSFGGGMVLGLPLATDTFHSPAMAVRDMPSLRARVIVVGFFLFLFFMALHEKCSVKFCIPLWGPVEPNLKSAECVWSRLLGHHTSGTFLKVASCGPSVY